MRLVNAATVPRAEKILRRAICPASIVVGNCVSVVGDKVGPQLQVDLADPTDTIFVPAIGVVIRKYTPTLCLVQSAGPMVGVVSGLVAGAPYYLSAAGQLTATPPPSPAHVQQMGIAWDSDEILLGIAGEGGTATAADFDVDRIVTSRFNPHDPPVHEEPSVVIEASTGNVVVTRP